MIPLFKDIDTALEEIADGWTSPKQGHQIAEAIIKLQPELSIEVGVFAGKGIICMGMAHAYIRKGHVIGIDPWSSGASIEGQVDPVHKNWWANLNHESIYEKCVANVTKYGLDRIVTLIRKKSDEVVPAAGIGFLRLDGNHGKTAMRDVKRFCPNVIPGGILHLDDADWADGARANGSDAWLQNNGWKEIDRIDTGAVYEKAK